ncbi:phage tail tape measure protein [Ursidibacter arcticus]
MAKNLSLELIVKARDYASRVLRATAQRTQQANQQITQSTQRSAQTQQAAITQTARVGEQAARTGVMSARRLATAREGLGIRSEREIQREINRTIAQYSRLKRSGTLTSRELARASEQARNRVRELNAEMGKTPMGQRVGNVARGVAGVGAGVIAGSMVMTEPVRKSMDYDRSLAMVANTAFSERDAAGRIKGKDELSAAVKKAVEEGGGTKEDALGALDQLLASGAVGADTAMKLLPTLQKGAVATGADTRDLSSIAISAMQQFGIDENQIGQVLDMAVAAGQAGNFELKDMARWLPQQMAAAKQMGLGGVDGLKTLLVANQQARVTAGTSDEAGNNLVNLLGKITSKETNERFENLEYTDQKGQKRKINYLKSMEGYKAQGKDSMQAFMAIMDDVIGSNKNYQVLQEKLKTAKGEEQTKLLDQMTNLVEGTAIGQIISDRQALMALLGIRNNVQLGKEVSKQIDGSKGAVDTSHEVIKSTNSYKTEDLKSTAEFAQMEGLKDFNDLLGQTSEQLSTYMKKYPELSALLTGLGTGVQALSVAAIAAAGSVALLGGRRGGGLLPDIGGQGGQTGKGSGQAGGRSAAGSVRAGGGRLGSLLRIGSKALGAVGVVDMAMVLGEQQPYQQAQREIAEEKRREGLKKFGQAYAKKNKATGMGFAYGDFSVGKTSSPMGKTSQGVPLYGGYALAHLSQDDKVAKARYEMGNYSQAEYEARVQRNEQERQQYITPSKAGGVTQAVGSGGNIANSVANSIAQSSVMLGELLGQSGVLKGEIGAVNGVLAQYQADFAAFGQTISDGLQAGLAAQSHTIDNRLVVELDGRVVAENVSQYFFNMANRG